MSAVRRQNVLKTLIAFAVVIGLLLLLTHVSAPAGNVLALIVLAADTLFAAIEIPATLWTLSESAVLFPQAPAAKFLFQRPPPQLA